MRYDDFTQFFVTFVDGLPFFGVFSFSCPRLETHVTQCRDEGLFAVCANMVKIFMLAAERGRFAFWCWTAGVTQSGLHLEFRNV